MKKHTVLVLYEGLEQEEYSYEQQENEQVCERFARVVEDKKLSSVEVDVKKNRDWVPLKEAEEEDRPYKGDRLVFFDMPTGDVRFTAKYVPDKERVRMRLCLDGIREYMAATPDSYFYGATDAINGDTFSFEEGKTFYYDDGEKMTFVLRLRLDADVRLMIGSDEYLPTEKEKRAFDGETVYEYTFGFVDEFDKKYARAKTFALRAPETTFSFRIAG